MRRSINAHLFSIGNGWYDCTLYIERMVMEVTMNATLFPTSTWVTESLFKNKSITVDLTIDTIVDTITIITPVQNQTTAIAIYSLTACS